jgi:hypothetical protein
LETVTMRDELDMPMPSMAPSYRVSRRSSGMDPNTRRLALIATGIGGSLMLLVGAWTLMGGHRHTGVPVVEADSRPLRSRPADPGGLEVAGADDAILSNSDQNGAKAAMAPAPEIPEPQVLKAESAKAEAAKAEAAKIGAAKPDVARSDAPRSVAAAAAVPVVPPPAMVQPAPRTGTAASAAPATPAAAGAPHPAVTAAAAGNAQVQLAAVGSEPAAKAEWERLSRKMPDMLGGRRPALAKVEHDGHVFWRVRTGGFTDAAQAAQFCAKVRAKGAGCSVASF